MKITPIKNKQQNNNKKVSFSAYKVQNPQLLNKLNEKLYSLDTIVQKPILYERYGKIGFVSLPPKEMTPFLFNDVYLTKKDTLFLRQETTTEDIKRILNDFLNNAKLITEENINQFFPKKLELSRKR